MDREHHSYLVRLLRRVSPCRLGLREESVISSTTHAMALHRVGPILVQTCGCTEFTIRFPIATDSK